VKSVNRQIRLATRPVGVPKISDFHLVYSALPTPAWGEVLVRSIYLSLDPYMRRRMNAEDSGAVPVALGGVMVGCAAGFVVRSADPSFQPGDAVLGQLGWQEYGVLPGSELRRVDLAQAPLSAALGILGTPGLTAYFGLLDVCKPKAGETVVVSGATGGIGMLAGQIAKILGCRVVGVNGPGGKPSWLIDELGFDGAIQARNLDELDGDLAANCPQGIDAYFDIVGGDVSEAVGRHLNHDARVALCAQTSLDNLEEAELARKLQGRTPEKRAKVRSFRVSSYTDRFGPALEQLAEWLKQGRLLYREDVAQGIEAAPQAFIGMLEGRNLGKQLVQLAAA